MSEALFTLAQAVERLADGGVVAMPTETVYGLAADAEQAAAVAQIFSIKGRPADHPLIVHVLGQAQASHYAAQLPAFALALMAAFWPGPLTLIVPRRDGVATAAAGGQASIGLRAPNHPTAQALLEACLARGIHGLAAPSANRFGRVSPTSAAHVLDEFDGQVAVLDGGACRVGIESTIIDCTRAAPVLLRPGDIAVPALNRVLAPLGLEVQSAESAAGTAPKASGTLAAHYAPRARLRLMDAATLQTALDVLDAEAARMATYSRAILHSNNPKLLRRSMPAQAQAAAQELFAVLRELDAAGVDLIWVETPPADASWDGVRDRLQRAAAAR